MVNIAPYISLYFASMGVLVIARNISVRKWPWCEGTLTKENVGSLYRSAEKFTTTDRVQEDVISAQIAYNYGVDGTIFTGHRLSHTLVYGSFAAIPLNRRQLAAVLRPADGKVRVHYNPRKPSSSVLILPGRFIDLAGIIALAAAVFI